MIYALICRCCRGQGATTLIGNALGAQESTTAAFVSRVAFVTGVLYVMASCASVFFLGDRIATLFAGSGSAGERIVAAAHDVWRISVIFQALDGCQAILSGTITAAGKQPLGAPVLFVAYWVIGLPLAAVLTFAADLDLRGIWFGMLAGVCLHVLVYLVAVARIDWPTEAELAAQRCTTEVGRIDTTALARSDCASGELEEKVEELDHDHDHALLSHATST